MKKYTVHQLLAMRTNYEVEMRGMADEVKEKYRLPLLRVAMEVLVNNDVDIYRIIDEYSEACDDVSAYHAPSECYPKFPDRDVEEMEKEATVLAEMVTGMAFRDITWYIEEMWGIPVRKGMFHNGRYATIISRLYNLRKTQPVKFMGE